MKEKFKTLPEALQWQILSRFAGGAGFFLLFIVIMIFYRNVYLWLPSLFFMVMLIVSGAILFYNSIKGNYVSVSGVCAVSYTHLDVYKRQCLYRSGI